jgi:hypothetical protein
MGFTVVALRVEGKNDHPNMVRAIASGKFQDSKIFSALASGPSFHLRIRNAVVTFKSLWS